MAELATENKVSISKIDHFNMISIEDAPESWGWSDIKVGVGKILSQSKGINFLMK